MVQQPKEGSAAIPVNKAALRANWADMKTDPVAVLREMDEREEIPCKPGSSRVGENSDHADHRPNLPSPMQQSTSPAESSEALTAKLLDAVAEFVRRYVVANPAQVTAAALWVLHTHAFAAAEATPYLHVTSAEKESGKTRLLEVLELITARPLKMSSATTAALGRVMAHDPPPTILLDESDNTFKRDREYVAALMAILNDGYRRGAKTLLCLPPKWEPAFMPVFAPKALAGIGELTDTLASRSIRMELKKRLSSEHVERFRRKAVEVEAGPLQERLAEWADQNANELTGAEPVLPDELSDRTQDVWEPLFAIADAAGHSWPDRARAAAVELSKQGEEVSLGVRLLTDIRAVLDRGHDRIRTADLIAYLSEIEESPWGDWYGKQITSQGISKLLRRYGIKTMPVKVDGQTVRGYKREQFEDVWIRHVSVTGVTSDLALQAGSNAVTPKTPPKGEGPALRKQPLPGDLDFVYSIRKNFENGHTTETEWNARYALHQEAERALQAA